MKRGENKDTTKKLSHILLRKDYDTNIRIEIFAFNNNKISFRSIELFWTGISFETFLSIRIYFLGYLNLFTLITKYSSVFSRYIARHTCFP